MELRFSVRGFGCALFYFGENFMSMKKKLPEKVMDSTGVELTPGKPSICLGNGEQGFECCCDECDFFLFCYPEYAPENIENKES